MQAEVVCLVDCGTALKARSCPRAIGLNNDATMPFVVAPFLPRKKMGVQEIFKTASSGVSCYTSYVSGETFLAVKASATKTPSLTSTGKYSLHYVSQQISGCSIVIALAEIFVLQVLV